MFLVHVKNQAHRRGSNASNSPESIADTCLGKPDSFTGCSTGSKLDAGCEDTVGPFSVCYHRILTLGRTISEVILNVISIENMVIRVSV